MGLNSMAWLALLVWIVVPVLAGWMFTVLPKWAKAPYQRKLIIAASLGVLVAPWVISTAVKWHYDQQVRALCAKDGGIKVYETVKLPAERFNQWGQLLIPDEKNSMNLKMNTDFYRETLHQELRTGNPHLRRGHYKIFRRVDGQLLGEAVNYARVGGDLPGPWIESSFGCPQNSDITDLKKAVFALSKE